MTRKEIAVSGYPLPRYVVSLVNIPPGFTVAPERPSGDLGDWVYELWDPRKNDVFYVGCSTYPINRLSQHITSAGGDRPVQKYINGLKRLGKYPRMRLISYHDDRGDAEAIEQSAIEYRLLRGRELCNIHPLNPTPLDSPLQPGEEYPANPPPLRPRKDTPIQIYTKLSANDYEALRARFPGWSDSSIMRHLVKCALKMPRPDPEKEREVV